MRAAYRGRAALALGLLVAAPAAFAWNAAGHRLVAAIAWREMAPATRAAAADLLTAHPDRDRWRTPGEGADAGRIAFIEASTWADDIRRDPRYHDDAPPAPHGAPDRARHRRWHHTDQPPRAAATTTAGELDHQLPTLLDRVAADAETVARSTALAWVLHLVGDAHQPLHVQSRYDAHGRGDRGGNDLWVETPSHPRRPGMSLHAYWDDLPGPPWLRGDRLEAAVDRLLAAAAPPRPVATPAVWIAESRQLATTVVYAGLDGDSPTIGEAYQARAREIADARIVEAGRRLAHVLDGALARPDVSRETR